MNSQEIIDSFYFRHACKEFDADKKISSDEFNTILETGRLSPSSFGFEPWRFLVIQNSDVREKIRSVTWGGQRQLPTCSHCVVILNRKRDMWFGSDYIMNLMSHIHKLPNEAVLLRNKKFADFQEYDFRLMDSARSLEDWSGKQTYIALANMMTTAAILGIDSCPIEGFNKEVLEIMLEREGILDRHIFGVSVMVAFGYRVTAPREKTRQPLECVVEWI